MAMAAVWPLSMPFCVGAAPRYSAGLNARAPETRPSASDRVSTSVGQGCAQRAWLRNVAVTRNAPGMRACGCTLRSMSTNAAGSRHGGKAQPTAPHILARNGRQRASPASCAREANSNCAANSRANAAIASQRSLAPAAGSTAAARCGTKLGATRLGVAAAGVSCAVVDADDAAVGSGAGDGVVASAAAVLTLEEGEVVCTALSADEDGVAGLALVAEGICGDVAGAALAAGEDGVAGLPLVIGCFICGAGVGATAAAGEGGEVICPPTAGTCFNGAEACTGAATGGVAAACATGVTDAPVAPWPSLAAPLAFNTLSQRGQRSRLAAMATR